MGTRRYILGWTEEGRIAPQDARRALRTAGALPTGPQWRQFVARFLIWLGTALVAAGVVLLLVHNWQILGRFARLAVVEGLFAAVLGVIGWYGLERVEGKLALLGAAGLVGALLALLGQTYPIGADAHSLFVSWGLALVPLAVVGGMPTLWLLLPVVANLAFVAYFEAFGGLFGVPLGVEGLLWALVALNTIVLVFWEVLAWLGASGRWGPRLVAVASGGLVTGLALWSIVDPAGGSGWGVPAWLLWLGVVYGVYRRVIHDVFQLAAAVSSIVLVAATFLIWRADIPDSNALLLVSLVVIGVSAAGARWLRAVSAEESAVEESR